MFERFTKEARDVVVTAPATRPAACTTSASARRTWSWPRAGRPTASPARRCGASTSGRTACARRSPRRPPPADASIPTPSPASASTSSRCAGGSRRPSARARWSAAAARGRAWSGRKPFSPAAKKALELSLREALQLGHGYIGAEHVVLGALRADDPALRAVLRRRGRSPEEVRAAVLAALAEPRAAAG